MSNIKEKTYENASFLERYFSSRNPRATRDIGRIASQEIVGLEKRFDAEVASGFSEALDGRVHTEYDFAVEGGMLIADDGESFEAMMHRARRDAYQLVAHDPEMQFVVDRFEQELCELYDQQAMARGETDYNTIITFSPMTMELAHKPGLLKKGFQRPDLTRSMVRLSHWDGSRMHILTRSLDHSTMELLRLAAQDGAGYQFNATTSLGMLGERVHGSMSLEVARYTLSQICTSFERHLERQTGKTNRQGAYPPEDIDLLAFVRSHPNVLANVRKEAEMFAPECKDYLEFEARLNACLFRHLALYDELLQGRGETNGSISSAADQAGGRAAENGIEYSLCGYVITGPQVAILGAQTAFESLSASMGTVQRNAITEKLSKDKRKGECLACAAQGSVFGCGLCARCNKVWCDEFRSTGNGLEISALSKRFASDKKKNLEHKKRRNEEELATLRKSKRFWN